MHVYVHVQAYTGMSMGVITIHNILHSGKFSHGANIRAQADFAKIRTAKF